MTSKELNEILNKTRRTPNISLTPKQVEELIRDLERLECIETVLDNIANRLKLEVKNIFTLETEIFNRLEILEILKKRLNIKIPYGSVNVISANNDDDYLLFEVELKEHTKIEEWLNNDK